MRQSQGMKIRGVTPIQHGRLHPRPEVDCQEVLTFLGYIGQIMDEG
jgi:hypothetical protein